MNRGNRGFDKLGDFRRSAEGFHRVVSQSVHEGYNAIIASDNQAESCDSGNCYVRVYDFEEGMDEEALRATIRQLVRDRKETQVGLARLIRIDATAFSKWLSGKRQLKVTEADILRSYLGVKEEERADKEVLLPVIGLVSAGDWREGFEKVMDWVPRPDRSLSAQSFVVEIEGDSMDKIALEGEQVIVDPRDLDLIAGKLYVVRNSEGETTFKRYCDNPARLEPCSRNPAHQTIHIGREGFTVIGRVRKKVMDL